MLCNSPSKPDRYCDSVLYELYLKNKTRICEFIGENKRQVTETGSNTENHDISCIYKP